jgi:hypothetical protein
VDPGKLGDDVTEADARVYAVLVGAGADKRPAVRAEHADRGAAAGHTQQDE